MSLSLRKLCVYITAITALLSVSMLALCDQTEALVTQCDSCHSVSEANAPIAPSLNGMNEQYLIEQMANFQQGQRGAHLDDQNIVPAHQLDQDSISLVAEFYEELEIRHSEQHPAFTIEGMTASESNGEALYDDQCSVCHGSWLGRWISNSPEIQQLPPRYMAKQIQAFAHDKRGFVTPNGYKNDMLDVAKGLSDQELLDIIQYINTHSESL